MLPITTQYANLSIASLRRMSGAERGLQDIEILPAPARSQPHGARRSVFQEAAVGAAHAHSRQCSEPGGRLKLTNMCN